MHEDGRRRSPDFGNLWPIALAPLIPAIGIAFRGHPDPRARLGAPALAAGAILIFAHGLAPSASTPGRCGSGAKTRGLASPQTRPRASSTSTPNSHPTTSKAQGSASRYAVRSFNRWAAQRKADARALVVGVELDVLVEEPRGLVGGNPRTRVLAPHLDRGDVDALRR